MSNLIVALQHAGGALWARMLPQYCFVCGENSAARVLCPDCESALPRLAAARCPVCAIDSPEGAVCGRCLASRPRYDAAHAAFPYAFPIREMVHAFKFDARFAVGRYLGQALPAALADGVFDCVVPAPLHPQRLAQRGFNQALLLAEPLARALRVPLLRDAIRKTRLVPTQAGLPLEARRRNLRGALQAQQRFDGLRVLVVDDVMTSGTTLDEIAATLKAAGAARVEALVVARTPSRHSG
ncbi:ComF family protein [Niveibacterium sp. 24ML]|uniref:ComF family protein n=1 Tax=Niveibacterium sp. 24ML TaxID=2985512 RepID=UPI0022705230|nr:ComF family protein [Niveibacterium sp. 24ML]MCX9155032.1 ComF family protein [Niveibacterium sp. 24ML]